MIQPMHDNILIEPITDYSLETDGGLALVDEYFKHDQRGMVVAVGPGRRDERGNRTPLNYKPGDIVVWMKNSPVPVKDGDKELIFVRADQILAKVNRE